MTLWRTHLRPLLPVAVVLAVPFLLRPRQELRGETGASLIVLTPHNEAIRSELGAAFRGHVQKTSGKHVTIDWRTPGGTGEIARYLAAQYTAAFRREWTGRLGRVWTSRVASAFANPALLTTGNGPGGEEELARRAFLASNVSAGADVLFGGGSSDFIAHAAAGRLVDSHVIAAHPEIWNPAVVPASVGGEPFWDEGGRWVGVCLSGYGICYNRDAVERLRLPAPSGWSDLSNAVYAGQLALADPSKSGSALKTFEMLIQQQMQLQAAADGATAMPGAAADQASLSSGWAAAMRLIRKVAANARYFTDSASKVPMDVAAGDAAAGMCIDFYGRSQSEITNAGVRPRFAFVFPRGGSSIGADPVGLLRGARNPELAASFIDYLLSEDGQKLWDYRVGAPGGPVRYALRRLPILPALYGPAHRPYLSDPDARPYDDAQAFQYRPEWTSHLLRPIAFVIRVMCVEPHDELVRAYAALAAHHHPPRAAALFDDVTLVDYRQVTGRIRATLTSPNPVGEITLANDMIRAFRRQYQAVVALAEAGQ